LIFLFLGRRFRGVQDRGIAIAMAMAMEMIGSTTGRGIPVLHFLIITIGFSCFPRWRQPRRGSSGQCKADRRVDPLRMADIACRVPLVAWRSLDTLTKAWP